MYLHMHKYARYAYLGDVPPHTYVLLFMWVPLAPHMGTGVPVVLGGQRGPFKAPLPIYWGPNFGPLCVFLQVIRGLPGGLYPP